LWSWKSNDHQEDVNLTSLSIPTSSLSPRNSIPYHTARHSSKIGHIGGSLSSILRLLSVFPAVGGEESKRLLRYSFPSVFGRTLLSVAREGQTPQRRSVFIEKLYHQTRGQGFPESAALSGSSPPTKQQICCKIKSSIPVSAACVSVVSGVTSTSTTPVHAPSSKFWKHWNSGNRMTRTRFQGTRPRPSRLQKALLDENSSVSREERDDHTSMHEKGCYGIVPILMRNWGSYHVRALIVDGLEWT
jgi:hypothetical protein